MKKLSAAIAAAAIMISMTACSAVQGKDYPVTVANYTFTQKPASVVCLSDSVADIMISCGYGDTVTGRTDECDQQELSEAVSIGSKTAPSVKKIENLDPDVVFADKTVSQDVIDSLTSDGVCVLNMITASDSGELETLYSSIGAVLEGNEQGRENGLKKAQNLMVTMSDLQRATPETDVRPVVCYLYDESCTAATSSDFCGKLFDYANATNAFAEAPEINPMEGIGDSNKYIEGLKRGDASYIFCDTGLRDKIMENPELQNVTAVKNGAVYEIGANVFERQGATVTETLSFIIETIYPELAPESKPEESSSDSGNTEESKPKESTPEESKPEENSTEESEAPAVKVEADDSLEITDTLIFEKGTQYDEFDKVQRRLAYLGFYDPENGFTGFFGDMSEEAFKAFEKANSLKVNGRITRGELKLLFSDKVVPAKGYPKNEDE